ncbi:hypothetical protein ACIPRI_14720 [Variovorax sp. LARHSF232]
MANPYALDQIAPQETPAADNPYALTAIEGDRQTAVRGTLATAIPQNPDDAAKANKLARTTGQPAEAIQRNLPQVEQQAQLDAYSAMIATRPVTRDFLTVPQQAAVAHDDTANLTGIESAMTSVAKAARYLTTADDTGGLLRDIGAGVWRANRGAAGVFQALAELPEPLVGSVLPDNPFRPAARYFAQAGATSEARAKALSPAGAGMFGNAVSSGVQSLTGNLLTLPLALLPGGQAPVLYGMAAQQGGQSYQQAREQGLTSVQALPFAASQAAIEYATEKLPMHLLLKDLNAGAAIGKTILRQVASEVPGEQVATVLQDLNEWAALPENVNKPFSAYLAERPSAAASTLIATVIGVGGQVGVMKTIQAAADNAAGIDRQAQAAEVKATEVEKLAKLAADSKLRARDPVTFRQFIDQVSEANGTAPTEMYVDAQTLANTLNQAGITQDQLEVLAPGVAEQIRVGNLVDGADIRIPMAELLAADPKITAPLIEHLRESPEAMSRAEAQQFLSNKGGALQGEVESEMVRAVQEAGTQVRSDAVRQHFEQQLTTAARYTESVNKAYATLLGSFYETQAARAGMAPEEFLQRYGLEITSNTAGGAQQLSQGEKKSKGPRAQLSFGQDITAAPSVISLLKGADLSSLPHEAGHFFLEVQADLAARIQARSNAGEEVSTSEKQIARDMGTLLTWFGVKGAPTTTSLHDWLAMSLDEKRSHHEQFARSFERYLMEGQAPSQELQSIFDRFRAWLVNIYKKIAALDSNLSDDVRAVMSRMLAADETIEAAEAARNLGPLFASAEQAGMTPGEYAAYQALGRQATETAEAELSGRLLRDMRWLSKAKERALAAAQREADTLRAQTKAEVTREVMSEPIYQAWQFLTGKQDKIAPGTVALEDIDTVQSSGRLRSSLAKEMSPEAYEVLHKRHMTSEDGGMHPDLVSELFPGFTSGDQLMRALALADPPQEVIEALTDQRMLERYGDISSPEDLKRAAEAAIANDVRARVIATELKAVMKATNTREGSVDVMTRAAKVYAAQVIARQKIKDVRPRMYSAAAARSAKLAAQSLGNTAEVAMHKRNELVNLQATRAASNAQREIEAAQRYIERVQKADLPPEFADQIEQILDRYDIKRSTTLKEISRRKSLMQWVESQREQGIEPDVPDYLLNEAARVSVKDLTVEEFRGLVDTVKQIEHLGRLKNKLLTAKDQRDFDAVRADLVTSILEHGKGRTADTRTPTTAAGRWLQTVKNFGAAHIKAATWARIMDGGKDGGPMWERFIRGANEAGDRETTMRAEATKRLSEIMAPVLKGGKMGGKGKFFPSIGRSLNRESIFAIALNTGNESNLQRLLDGEGWTQAQLQPVLDTLTAQEWTAVQQVWDFFESYRPQIAAKELRVFGREPEWIQPKPVQTKTAGTLRGGYYPVKYDPAASVRAEEHADAEAAKQQLKGAYSAATTRRSFTKARAEEVHGRPLLYTLSGMYGGVNDVIHDLAWHEWLIDTNRLLRSKPIDEAMRGTYGPAVVRQLKTWRDAVALGDSASQEAIDSMLSRVRQGVSIAGLGFNVMSAAMQPLGLTQSIVRVGAKWIGKGMTQYIGAPIAKTREVNEKSDFMANRSRTRFRELNELRNRVEGQTAVREKLNASAYVLMMRFQQAVDVPTWLGAYEKATAAGKDEASAVALADQAVIDAQGGGQMKDLSAIERGGSAQKLFTVFYSFMNTALNVGVAQGMTNKSAAKTAADMALLYVVPAVLGALLKDALTPGDSGDDEEKLAKKLLAEQLGFLFGLFVGVREVGEAAKTAAGLTDHARDYSGPAGVRMFSDAQALAKQVAQGEFDDAFRKAAINLTGDLLALPSAQINRTITGAKALAEGETSNPAALLFGYQKPR